jgi:hypothetical protein
MDQYKDFAEIYDELIYSDINYEEWSETILIYVPTFLWRIKII